MPTLSQRWLLVLLVTGAACKPNPPAAVPEEEVPAPGTPAAKAPAAPARPAAGGDETAPGGSDTSANEDSYATHALLERLRSPVPIERYKAVFEAKKLKTSQVPKAIAAELARLYADPKEGRGTREVAGRALARCDPAAALAAWQKVKDYQSWDILIEVGPSAIPLLRRQLTGTAGAKLELTPFISLTEIVRDSPEHPGSVGAIPLLLQALDPEEDPRLQALAAQALSAFGGALNKALAGLLGDPLAATRRHAALAAAMLDAPDQQLLSALQRAAKDKDPAVRRQAQAALKKHRGKSKVERR